MAYKAFNPDFTCKGKQYEENTTYEENGNEICGAGVMHYCENPFDVLDYYPLVNENGEISEFAEVEPLGKAKKGSWITLAEWVRTGDKDEKGFCIWVPKCVKTEYVDGERIKEDIFYELVDGEFKEVEEN